MTTRAWQLEQVAYGLAERIDDNLRWTWDEVRAANATGWTMDASAPLGGILRIEGVVLTAAELARCFVRASEIALGDGAGALAEINAWRTANAVAALRRSGPDYVHVTPHDEAR